MLLINDKQKTMEHNFKIKVFFAESINVVDF